MPSEFKHRPRGTESSASMETRPILGIESDVDPSHSLADDGDKGTTSAMPSQEESSTYRTYPTRWVVLVIFCCLSCSNNFQWIIFSPITDRVAEYFDCTSTQVNWLPVTYNLVYVLLVFPVCSLYERVGLRRGMLVGAIVNVVGAAGKVIAVWFPQYWLLVVFETISGAGQLFVLGLPPLVSAIWFSDRERTLATALMSNASNLGIALGFLICPLCVPTATQSNMLVLFGHQAVVCVVVCAAIVAFVQDKPPTPPSATANLQAEPQPVVATLRVLVANADFVWLCISIGLCQSVFGGVCVVLTQILQPFGVSDTVSGWLGFVSVLTGITACTLLGLVIDRIRRYKVPLLLVFLLSSTAQTALVIALRTTTSSHVVTAFALVCLAQTLIAFTYPLAFEFVAELSHPAPESIAGGAVMWVNNFLTTITTLAMSQIISNSPSVALATDAWIVGIVACAASGMILLLVAETRNRVTKERLHDGGGSSSTT